MGFLSNLLTPKQPAIQPDNGFVNVPIPQRTASQQQSLMGAGAQAPQGRVNVAVVGDGPNNGGGSGASSSTSAAASSAGGGTNAASGDAGKSAPAASGASNSTTSASDIKAAEGDDPLLPKSPFPGMSDADYRGSMAAGGDVQMTEMKRRGYTHQQMLDYISRGAGHDYQGEGKNMTYGLSDLAFQEVMKGVKPEDFNQPTIPGTNLSWSVLGRQPVGRMHAAWGTDSIDTLNTERAPVPMNSSYSEKMLPTERAQMGPLAPLYDLYWRIAKPQTSYYDYGYPGSPKVFPKGQEPYDVTTSEVPENKARGKNMTKEQIQKLLDAPNSSGNGVSLLRNAR